MPTLNLPARGEIPWDDKINAALELLSDGVDAALPATQKGAASGVAPLGSDSKVPDANLPTRLGADELNAAFATAAQGAKADAAIPNTVDGRAATADSDEVTIRYAQVGTLQAKSINPVARGAKADYTGRNGTPGTGTDARAAINAALSAASNLTGVDYYNYLTRRSYPVVMPAGDYLVTANAFGTASIIVPAGVTFDFSAASLYFDYPATATSFWCGVQVGQYGNVIVGKMYNSKRVAAPDGATIYDGIRLMYTDNNTRILGYHDSEISGFQGACIRGVAAWISLVAGIRLTGCRYGYIASNVSDSGAYYGVAPQSTSGSGTVTTRVHTDLTIRDCQFVNLSHGGILGVVQGNAAHANEADYAQSGLQLYLEGSVVFENIGAEALQIYNAFVVNLGDIALEEVGKTGSGMMLFDTIRALNYGRARINLAGRSVPGPGGAVTPFPAHVFQLTNVLGWSGEGVSHLHNTYNAALKWENTPPSRFDLGPVTTDAYPLPYGPTRRKSITGCRLRRTANLTVTTSTSTAVPFTAEDWDTDGFHDNSTNPSRFTVPAGYQGKYELSAGIAFANNATGRRTLLLRLNGSGSLVRANITAPAGGDAPLTVTTKVALVAGDYVEVIAYHEAGADLVLDVTNLGAAAAWFTAERIAD